MWDWFAWLRLNEKILMYHSIWIVSFRQSWFLRLWLHREKISYASHDMRLEVRRYAYCSNALVSLVKNRPHIKALTYASNFRSFRIPNMSLAQFRFSDIKTKLPSVSGSVESSLVRVTKEIGWPSTPPPPPICFSSCDVIKSFPHPWRNIFPQSSVLS